MNWTELWNQIVNMNPGWGEICLRLACAMLVGLVIGTEREYTHRPAGMRTHILVALGACVVSITGELLFHHYSQLGSTADPARLSAQVITGVGFLGAGTILKQDATVKGLTTAASVWAVACLGIASGFGYYAVAIFGMVFIFVTLTIFEWLQNLLVHPKNVAASEYTMETTDISAALTLLNETARAQLAQVHDVSAKVVEGGHLVTFQADFGNGHRKRRRQHFFDALITSSVIRSVRCSDEAVGAK